MYEEVLEILPSSRVRFNEPMCQHTSFKIGGPCDVMILPESADDIKKVLAWAQDKKIPVFILGLGSNILVRDKGIRGIVIKLGNCLNQIEVDNDEIYAEAGVRLSLLAKKAAASSLSGLEFAEGIPGSLGGAIFMNAGAYGGEIKDVIKEVYAVDEKGDFKTFYTADLKWGYRYSIFQENGHIILGARLKLKKGNRDEIIACMQELGKRRREKQPLDFPSAGSIFKRPEGYYVGPMLEKLGLKGYRIGGAEVSFKHAGFIVNTGGATCEDVLQLIDYIKAQVKAAYNLDLEVEVKIVGEK
ncbi:UDP-N-acetylmuramate dehydrogenase [Thermosyntropha lipolytica DSM 11003]|uniref:UDP-N-acetylenolpyruvoylglucosamine reductase n=1 Tax=Thermosyntropha lipolytica DSM 11003 TaxID=1123382 RepID=A0A1M5PMV1_9FIRM|nr:UDP-N-acetylmuramate dehydrogenase [Thermosyntropha lipolytica]SHH03036.1 UDP-N-acetylmuramate dehydrogenase [Thermosyntropha lipolytica DSM 11003]